MRKIMNLPEGTTTDDLEEWSRRFVSPIAVKLKGGKLELWIEDYEKTTELDALKQLFSGLARDAPPADSPHRGEYEETMRQLESELREKGVDL
ncbi:MAG: hypothetical protein L6300_12740 [Syntrophaceae bacterium]|nr:hypothetical protein [Syntrophaceae bacterium]